jgi:S1-C subfamily serine protease
MASQHENYSPAPRALGSSCLGLFLLFDLIVAGVVAVWLFWPGGAPLHDENAGLNPQAQPRPVEARGDLAETEKTNIAIYEQATPSLVQVTNLAVRNEVFGLDVQEVPQGVGSGFVWDDLGHIVTNFHVIKEAQAARVTLSDKAKTQLQAQRVWAYPDKDIAVLWVDVPKGKLKPVALGTSHNLKVGQLVFALGDPFGLNGSMSNGIVSALGREIRSVTGTSIPGVIQTTAILNPGNSGGPLLDSSGRLIGMNTAILSPTGAFAGIGFAIPVDEINRIVPQLIKHGKVVRPYIGVRVVEDQVAQELGVDEGALILKVEPDSPAAKAGLHGTTRAANSRIHLGDVIVAIDGKAIKNSKDLYHVLGEHHAGDTVKLTIERNGARQDVQLTLGESGER